MDSSKFSNAQIGGAGMGATGGGGILSAFGALDSGIANSKMYGYQSAVAKLNQQIDQQNAEFATQTGEQQATQSGMKTGQQIAQTKVAQASSGFDVNSGSNKMVQGSETQIGRMNTDIIRSDAAKTAYNYQTQGVVAGAQADLYKTAGDQSITAGVIGAGSSILGTAGSVSNEWLQGARVGLFNGSGSAQYGMGGYGNYGS